MNALLMSIHEYLEQIHPGTDLYTASDEQLFEAGRCINGNGHLPKTSRAKSTVSVRWETSLWKKAHFFASCDTDSLYTLLVELKTYTLYSKETQGLAQAISEKLPGDWFYWVEKGKENGIHMHVLIACKKPPMTRISLEGKYFKLNPRPFHWETTPLEAIVRTVTYGAKVREGGYRGDGNSWKRTWLNEVRQAIGCERVRTVLSDSNLTKYTRHMKVMPEDIRLTWEALKEDRQKKNYKKPV